MIESQMWIPFLIIIFALLAFDLGVFNKKAHASGLKEAIGLTVLYVIISLLFAGWIYISLGADKSYEFLTFIS